LSSEATPHRAGKICSHCGHDLKERWHRHYGVQKLGRGSGEVGVPLVGKMELRKEALVMVYVCELTNLPVLVTLAKMRSERRAQ
jgi:hypothetical protein